MAEKKTAEERRIELQHIFEDILGSKNVYFQPPETQKLKYPCILYFKSNARAWFADDIKYIRRQGYTVTLVEYDPDSDLEERISEALTFTRTDSYYRSEGLNHTKLTIFY